MPRNKALFKMFNLIGLGEHAGSGVPDIYKAWHDAGLSEPVVEENFGGGNPDRTILTLPLVSDDVNLVLLGKGTKKSTKKGAKQRSADIPGTINISSKICYQKQFSCIYCQNMLYITYAWQE